MKHFIKTALKALGFIVAIVVTSLVVNTVMSLLEAYNHTAYNITWMSTLVVVFVAAYFTFDTYDKNKKE